MKLDNLYGVNYLKIRYLIERGLKIHQAATIATLTYDMKELKELVGECTREQLKEL